MLGLLHFPHSPENLHNFSGKGPLVKLDFYSEMNEQKRDKVVLTPLILPHKLLLDQLDQLERQLVVEGLLLPRGEAAVNRHCQPLIDYLIAEYYQLIQFEFL